MANGKIVRITNRQQSIPVEKCREMLNRNGITYTDEEVNKVRDYLYQMAAVTIEEFTKCQQAETEKSKIISIQQHKSNEYEKSHLVRTG